MKKFITVLMCIVILVNSSVWCSAFAEKEPFVGYTKFTNYWISTQYDSNANVRDVIPIENVDGDITGYSISFSSLGKPMGYVVLDLSDNTDVNPIVEYSLEGSDPYTSIANRVVNNNLDITNISEKMISLGAFSYAVQVHTKDDVKMISQQGKTIDLSTYKIRYDKLEQSSEKQTTKSGEEYGKSTVNFWDAWLDTAPGVAKNQKTIYGTNTFVSLDMSKMPSYYGDGLTAGDHDEGNCGPTAVTTIMEYWRVCRAKSNLIADRKIDLAYARIAALLKYDPEAGTFNHNIKSAVEKYAEDQGYEATVDNYWTDTWSDFTRDINNDITILTQVGGKDDDGKQIGHYCVAFGYRENKDGSRFLQVANGWDNSCNRFLKFKPSELNQFNGFAISIT